MNIIILITENRANNARIQAIETRHDQHELTAPPVKTQPANVSNNSQFEFEIISEGNENNESAKPLPIEETPLPIEEKSLPIEETGIYKVVQELNRKEDLVKKALIEKGLPLSTLLGVDFDNVEDFIKKINEK